MTGLSEKQRADFNLMKELAKLTKKSAPERVVDTQ